MNKAWDSSQSNHTNIDDNVRVACATRPLQIPQLLKDFTLDVSTYLLSIHPAAEVRSHVVTMPYQMFDQMMTDNYWMVACIRPPMSAVSCSISV